MDTLQRKKIALENSLRANGNANPSYFSVTQVSLDSAPPHDLFLGYLCWAKLGVRHDVDQTRLTIVYPVSHGLLISLVCGIKHKSRSDVVFSTSCKIPPAILCKQ